MKQITLHVYQSLDGCPVGADKHFDAAADASCCVLIDEETYLRIYLNHLGWPLTAKETLVVTGGCIDLTEKERVRFVTGDAAAELRRIKADGEGTVTAYGAETGALLLDNGLADEIVVTTVPVLVGGGDYPVSMIGSGVVSAGTGSDITGTSSIITVLANTPMLHPEVSNVATMDGLWGRFMLLDSGGDAVRWARRAFHQNQLSYDDVTRLAGEAPAGFILAIALWLWFTVLFANFA